MLNIIAYTICCVLENLNLIYFMFYQHLISRTVFQALVVLGVNNAFQWISVNRTNYPIHWRVTYPEESVTHPLNTRKFVFPSLRK